MVKIINGKRYDTDTARLVGAWDNGTDSVEVVYVEETLYRKHTGEFFLLGYGGPDTRYAHLGEHGWECGEKIFPQTYESAKQWAKEHLSPEEYDEIFGEIKENNAVKTITLSMNAALIQKGKREAVKKGMNFSKYVESLVLAAEEESLDPALRQKV